MTQLFNLAIFTKKEIMKLLIDEKRASYRKGYKAGAAMRYRHEGKKEVPVAPVQPAWGWPKAPLEVNDFPAPLSVNDFPPPPEVSAQVTDENAMPTAYGDSLPVKPMPEVTEKVIVHIGDIGPVETGTITDTLTYR
jgi:hypothetical protein